MNFCSPKIWIGYFIKTKQNGEISIDFHSKFVIMIQCVDVI